MDKSKRLVESERAIAELRKQIGRSTTLAVGVIGLALFAYIVNFVARSGIGMSADPEQWGQFGDYLGGILNPMIALLAFYWLTRSVLLQKEEMQRTADALTEAASHQDAQVKLTRETARINALAALLASADATLSIINAQIQTLETDRREGKNSQDLSGNLLYNPRDIDTYRKHLGSAALEAEHERKRLALLLKEAIGPAPEI